LIQFLLPAAVLSIAFAAVREAHAGTVLVTSPAALAPDDAIDWGQLGPDSTSLSDTAMVSSAKALLATVSTADASGLVRVDEGLSWTGNFALGDHLISNNTFSYFPLTISFASPIGGAGAQIQLDSNGPFTATIQAFSGATSLGIFTEDGVSTTAKDGSAIFIGVLDSKAEITSIVFGIDNPPASFGDFAINSLLINTSGAVPEPASLALVTIALPIVLGIWRCCRSPRAQSRGSSGALS
jgi:hypothetical protein